ncbi:MAG: DUF2812 domain-containing protein [Erysipelotrichales bacterium]|nr:DUF2812 domain-containing protein [Erysipelotrichales bacterium]MBQ4374692.1 DUF2812 domain-containing protein [Erysipelotrichales bacterium]
MTERTTIRKWFFVWDFEKEEEWLNEMALSGWALVSVGFCRYTFERTEPGEYIIRLEMHKHDPSYLAFMEETNAEYVGRVFQWIYFRRKSEYGPFDIFSDIDSKIEHLRNICRVLFLLGIGNILIGIGNSLNGLNIGWINLICGSLLMYGLGNLRGKVTYLEKERKLRE